MKKFYTVIAAITILLNAASAQLLLSESYEGSFPPAGWTLINAGSGNQWTYNTDPSLADGPYAARTGTGAAVYEASTNAANAWMITSGVTLNAGTSYTISFYYAVSDNESPERLRVTVGSSPTGAGQTQVLWNNAGATELTNLDYRLGTANFTPSTTGTYYFGFNAFSTANQAALVVDDIRIEATPASVPSCTTPVSPANGATNVTVPSTTFSWNAVSGATSYDVYFSTSNPPSAAQPVNVSTTSVVINGFATNTTYYWYVVPRNAAGQATGCASTVRSFTTENIAPPTNNECASAIQLSPYTNGGYNGYTINATASTGVPSCGIDYADAPDDDVWFRFTAVQSGTAIITVTGASTFDAVIQAFSGTCGSLTQIGSCEDETFDGEAEMLTLNGLVAGQTYYLRIFDYSTGYGDRFNISISGAALPVVLSEFSGRTENSSNVLSWKTSTEINNKGFEIEKSVDGKNFSSIAFVSSKADNGNSTSSLNYTFIDNKPFNATNYYRLKQVDKDGKYSYSDIVSLKNRISDFRISNIYPNPAKDELKILINSIAANRATIVITDLSGKNIYQKTTQLMQGENIQKLNVELIAKGTYLVKVIASDGSETGVHRFVKN